MRLRGATPHLLECIFSFALFGHQSGHGLQQSDTTAAVLCTNEAQQPSINCPKRLSYSNHFAPQLISPQVCESNMASSSSSWSSSSIRKPAQPHV
ncbi:unnamed protein product [Protopolystoma xenopodis]|uniref:Uncharacterized protein n=1 Tax=Protopolystoma xenopodis TaxID=117903 RepID=A0A448XHQ8_9PLAT|nr:unnamed protein product [Protopolystoma xenopodis]